MKKRTIIASAIFIFIFYILENIISIWAYGIRDDSREADVVIVLEPRPMTEEFLPCTGNG